MRKRTIQRVAALVAPVWLVTAGAGAKARADDSTWPTSVIGTTTDSTLVEDLAETAGRCAGAETACVAAATLARSLLATIGGCVAGVLPETDAVNVDDSVLTGPDTLDCAGRVEYAREAGLALRVFVARCLEGTQPTCGAVTDTVDVTAAAVEGCAAATAKAATGVSVEAPPDGLRCGTTVILVRDMLVYVATLLVDLGLACVARSEPLCDVAFDAAELVQDRAEGCLRGALTAAEVETDAVDGADPGCGGAVDLLVGLAADVAALVDDCLSGADAVGAACDDVRDFAADVGSAVAGCASLAAGSPCRTALDTVTYGVGLAEGAVAACLAGAQPQCTTASTLVADLADCSEIMQAAGLCVGYYTTGEEQDPVLAAIAGALRAGGLESAYLFAKGSTQALDAAESALVDAAFEAEAEEAGAGVALLYGATGVPVPDVDAVPMPETGTAAKYTPKEAQHGHCCATAPQAWKWHGREVNWGSCQTNDWGYTSCASYGHFWADVHGNINYFPSVLWSHDFWHKSGHRAEFRNLSVKMKQDIAKKADPTKAKYSCAGGTVPLSCGQERESPDVVGKYYYDELNADLKCHCGKPDVHLQIQTRRWYVWSGGYPFYPAYDNGG